MFKKIVITGGNGFLGTSLTKYFYRVSEKIIIISRKPVPTSSIVEWKEWDGETQGDWTNALEGADAVINLAGRSVDCRYTEKNKTLIYDSRLKSTKVIGEAIRNCKTPPKVWINSSSATIYNGSYSRLMTEATGEIGDDFSMNVCKKWEAMFNSFTDLKTRQVILRSSIVLGWDGGALPVMRKLVKYGLGGRQGDGKQFCSWIHIRDFCRAVEWLIENESTRGAYNITAPTPVPNKEFMATLRKELHVPLGLSSPEWLLKIGAVFIRTQAELVLKSRKVYPKRLLDEGFHFRFEKLKDALEDLAMKEA
jgi:uncharacterized protein